MKTTTVIGIASIAANIALLGVIAYGSLASKPAVRLSTGSSMGASAPKKNAGADGAEGWADLASSDLAAQRDRLKEEAFPPSAIRAILAAQIREQFAARRKAIDAGALEQPYWKNPMPDPQSAAQLRALAKEEQKLLRDLLGPDPVNSHAARLRREFPDLAAEKIDQVAAIRERYDEMRQEIYSSGFRGQLTPSEREKINAMEKAMHAEFAAVLTPEELEHYDLRTSNTANNLRYTLANFGATEAEFRALYRLQSAFDEQYRYSGGTMTPEQQRARSDAQKKFNEDIAAALGTARYADYRRASDYNFRQTSQLVSRLNLPPETAMSLYAVQKDAEDRRNALYRNSTPESRGQMTEKLTALANEATARITTILGGNATATAAYKQYGGSWLNNLVPRPPVAPTPKK
jgi:hypothetical protein